MLSPRPECDSYTENYEQQTTRKQPSSLGRKHSHASLQGLDFKQCRRFIQAQRSASLGLFIVSTFLLSVILRNKCSSDPAEI